MNRRQALRQAGLAAGAAALWATLPARTWAALARPGAWSQADEDLLTLIGDTILPATADSPGAASVAIGRFVITMLHDCHGPEVAETVRRAMQEIESASRSRHVRPFRDLSQGEREGVLTAYEKQAAGDGKGRAGNAFRPIKELTLLGYFTSEPGATRALRYDPVPGGYRGSIRLEPGDKSWLVP